MENSECNTEEYAKIGYHLIEFLRLDNRYGDFDELKKLVTKKYNKIQEKEILEELLI